MYSQPQPAALTWHHGGGIGAFLSVPGIRTGEDRVSRESASKLFKTEDYWASWLGMLVIAVALVSFFSGSSIQGYAVTPGQWDSFSKLCQDLASNLPGYSITFLGLGLIFSISMAAMGHSLKQFLPGYVLVFLREGRGRPNIRVVP